MCWLLPSEWGGPSRAEVNRHIYKQQMKWLKRQAAGGFPDVPHVSHNVVLSHSKPVTIVRAKYVKRVPTVVVRPVCRCTCHKGGRS